MANDGSEPAGETGLRSFRIGGQAYRFVVSRSYINRDGKLTTKLQWEGTCWDCGKPFAVLTDVSPDLSTMRHLSRRCGACKKPGLRCEGKPAPATPHEIPVDAAAR